MLGVTTVALLLATGAVPAQVQFHYALRVDTTDYSGYAVELRIRNAPAGITLAAPAHPEYDDRYWRHITDLRATDATGQSLTLTRADSALWRVANPAGDVTVRYRLRLPPAEAQRAAWRPFLSPTGGLVGGPHSFLYVLGSEAAPATVTLELPAAWQVATGLAAATTPRTFDAPDLHTLMESPMLVGVLSEWTFTVADAPHRIFYWRQPDAVAFDTTTFVRNIERLVRQTVELFGSVPYRDYTFMFQDGAFGALEHPNSVTLGAPSAALARDPNAVLEETAHEFVHTWNLMRFKPVEYRGLEYRTQPPVAGLWFSEGLTIFYADLLLRRAGLPTADATRSAHLQGLIQRYLSGPGNARFSAEAVSRVAYNAGPGALGDYTVSTHLQGELIGAILDIAIRDATDGARSMDDVIRLMNTRFAERGFTGADIESVVSEVCGCTVREIFDRYVRGANALDFDRHLSPIGLRANVTWAPATMPNGQPARDLRIWGYVAAGEQGLRLMINDPASAWGRAGLHTGDRLVSMKSTPVRTWPELRTLLGALTLGESVDIVVERPAGRFETRVVVSGYEVPVVRIEQVPEATERQRRLQRDWLQGRSAVP